MKKRGKSIWLTAALLFGLVMASPSYAGKRRPAYRCPSVPEDDAAALAMAGELFEQGERLGSRKKFQKSLVKFLCAASISDHINTTLNIAQAARYVRNKRKLLRILNHFIEENPDSQTAEELGKLVAIIEEGTKR